MIEAKPCPACVGEEISSTFYQLDERHYEVQVICDSCNAEGPAATGYDEDEAMNAAARAWNEWADNYRKH